MTETDPAGKAQHSPGAKLDGGKPKVGLMLLGFSKALESVAEVTTFGAKKYTPDGWKKVDGGIERYTDALGRHLLKEKSEGYLDSDSQLPHAAQVAWNALARLELILNAEDK